MSTEGGQKRTPFWPAIAVMLPIMVVALSNALKAPASVAWDFHQFYTAGQIRAGDLYNQQAQQELDYKIWQADLKPLREFSFAPFLKPAYYRVVLVYLARLPFWKAYGVWVTIQLLCLIAAIMVLASRFGYHASWYLSLPLCPYIINSLIWGQDTALVLLLVALSFDLLLRGRDQMAGATLALGLVKYNVIMLLPVLLVVKRKWRALAAFCSVACVEIALSCWVIPGKSGLRDYISLLGSDCAKYWDPQMPCLHGISVFLGYPKWLALLLSLAAVPIVLFLVRNLELETAFPLVVAASVFLAWHAMWYDLTFFLIPVVALPPIRSGWKLVATVLFLSPLSYRLSHGYALMLLALMLACLCTVVSDARPDLDEKRAMAAALGG